MPLTPALGEQRQEDPRGSVAGQLSQLVSFRPERDPASKKKVDNSCGHRRLSSDPHMHANYTHTIPAPQAQVRLKAPSHARSVHKD